MKDKNDMKKVFLMFLLAACSLAPEEGSALYESRKCDMGHWSWCDPFSLLKDINCHAVCDDLNAHCAEIWNPCTLAENSEIPGGFCECGPHGEVLRCHTLCVVGQVL